MQEIDMILVTAKNFEYEKENNKKKTDALIVSNIF